MKNFHVPGSPKLVTIIAGAEGTFKTTVALTAPDPIYVIGTEEGHEEDTLHRVSKANKKKVFVTRFERERATKYPSVWFGAYRGVWQQVMEAIEELKTAPEGTVVFDSATDLFPMAAAFFNVEMQRGDKPIPPLAYTQVYPLLRDVVNILRGKHHLILTARLKDEWIANESTGNQVLALWKDAEYLAENLVFMEVLKPLRMVFAHGHKGAAEGSTILSPTIEKITGGDYWFGSDDSALYRTAKSIVRAFDALDSKALPYERKTKFNNTEEYDAYLTELRDIWTSHMKPTTNGILVNAPSN